MCRSYCWFFVIEFLSAFQNYFIVCKFVFVAMTVHNVMQYMGKHVSI